jgi:5-methylcytosine-specific restriction endonuclease McrA
MPKKPPTVTSKYGSPKPAKRYNRYRDPKWRKQWANLRKMVGGRDNWICCDCGQAGTEVDHIEPWKHGGDWADLENLCVRCCTCHSKKTARERAERRK